MDAIWRYADSELSDTQLAATAFKAFRDKWIEEGQKPPDEMTVEETQALLPRSPGIAAEMLVHYIKQRRPYIAQREVMEIEKPFVVPIGRESEMYVGRLDKIFDDPQIGKIIAEHKTTSLYKKGGPFRNEFIEGWSPENQVDGYLHAGHMLYGDDLKYLYVDAALVHKEVHDGFKFIGINRAVEQLDAWLYETHYFMEEIRHNMEVLYNNDWQKEPYLAAFPKNTNACFEYMRPCPYRDVCRMVSNPEKQKDPPPGMVVEKWQPFDVLGLEQLGLPKEED